MVHNVLVLVLNILLNWMGAEIHHLLHHNPHHQLLHHDFPDLTLTLLLSLQLPRVNLR